MTPHAPARHLLRSSHAAAAADAVPAEKAVHAVELDGEAADWVQLLPAATFRGRDGRGPFHVRDAQAVIQQTRERSGGNDLPIDFGHALEAEGIAGDGARG